VNTEALKIIADSWPLAVVSVAVIASLTVLWIWSTARRDERREREARTINVHNVSGLQVPAPYRDPDLG
jgi:hypothetical protein